MCIVRVYSMCVCVCVCVCVSTTVSVVISGISLCCTACPIITSSFCPCILPTISLTLPPSLSLLPPFLSPFLSLSHYRKLRIKPPIQLLVNVCVSLLLLYLMYIGGLYARTHDNACIVFSYLFQYTFSVSLLALLGQMVSVVFLGIKSTFPVIISIISWSKIYKV